MSRYARSRLQIPRTILRVVRLDKLFDLFDALGGAYKYERYDLNLIPPIVEECYAILGSATPQYYNEVKRKLSKTQTLHKEYWVFEDGKSKEISRPYRPSLFFATYPIWFDTWKKMLGKIDQRSRSMHHADTDKVLYSASTAFFAVIDLYMRDARKRNGTFFEWLLGTLLYEVTGYPVGAHIAILSKIESTEGTKENGDSGNVPTDIVLDPGGGRYKLVFPAKISTRERINQIFTHQRILDTEFPGQYRSALLCVSECQLLTKGHRVQETCVPTQVSFNERYIAHIDALYYLDPPFPYIADAIRVPVRRISDLFATDLAAMTQHSKQQAQNLCGAVISTVRCNLPKHANGEHVYMPPRGAPITSSALSAADVAD